MLELNFLSEKEQQKVGHNLIWLVLRNSFVWLLLITFIVVMLLLWSKFFLENNLANVQERGILVSGSKLTFASQIEQINATLDEVEEVQKQYVAWSQVLASITQIIPSGNLVSELAINSPEQTFSLSGFSQTRGDLLNLEKNLKASDLIVELNSPVSNLLKPKDIQFTFSGKLFLREIEEEEEEIEYRD